MNFFQSWLLTIGVETLVLLFIFRKRYDPDIIARNSVLASTATLPLIWFVFARLGLAWYYLIPLSELFAIGAEGYIYALLFQELRVRDALSVSLVCNLSSFLAGLFFILAV